MSDTVFVTMYHPALGNVQVQAPLQAVSLYAAHGWLLVDGSTPAPSDIAFTEALGDVRYLRFPTGGSDGQALVKSGSNVVWGTVAGGGGLSVTDNTDGTASTTSTSVADNGDGTATAA